jgi:hypothetical protein
MKKLLSLLVMITVIVSFTSAQRATQFPIIAGDTVITSSALDTVSKVITATAGYSALGIQVVATKVSGTITAKAYLYSSLDGTTYQLTDSATAFANSAGAQSVWFTKTTTPYVFYKVQVRNVGGTTSTESLAVKVYYVLRRHD